MIPKAVSENEEGFKTLMLRPELEPERMRGLEKTMSLQNKCTEVYNLNSQEAWSDPDKQVLYSRWKEHGFVSPVRIAYNHHIPLAFSPDQLWNMIIQAVSKHIENNSEELRHHFVNFDGKQTLTIRRDHFTKGSSQNDWPGCFEEWVSQIEGFIGSENKETLCPEFSTTTPLEMACTNLGVMDSMKSYFAFKCCTMCGIKAVRLYGTVEDWEHLHENVMKLREYDLEWWIDDYIEPLITNILKTYKEEEVNSLFWECIYKHYSGSGSGTVDTVDGWIVNFFPYNGKSKNDKLVKLETLYKRSKSPPKIKTFCNGPGMDESDVPNGIAQTPFIWEYLGENIPMEFHSGFIGAEIEEDSIIGKFVKPVQFWAVSEAIEKEENVMGFN